MDYNNNDRFMEAKGCPSKENPEAEQGCSWQMKNIFRFSGKE
jgi:hypothetical protein